MRVFVTGASGWVGSTVSRQLLARGHDVTGLARSDKSAAIVSDLGAHVRRGDLSDLDGLAAGATAADAVIHCGFIHDFSDYAKSVVVDRQAIEAMGAALAGTGKTLLVTSGMGGLAAGRPSTEEDTPDASFSRLSEQSGLALLDRDVGVGVVRLPPSVHGRGDHGFVAALIGIARQKGASAYVDTGSNVWSSVDREDAARVFALALEKGSPGWRYHAVGDTGVPFRDIAAIIGRKLDLPVVSIPAAEAGAHFGWMGPFVQFDVPASAALTSERLGWHPTGSGLLQDLEHGAYFDA